MGTGKKKIDIEPITDYQSRMVTFNRRRTSLFKKAKKRTCLSGSSLAIVVLSETGQPYIHSSPSLLLDRFISSTAATTIGAGSPTATVATGSFVDKFRACVNSGAQACDNVERLKQIKKMADDLYTFCASSSSNDVGRLKLIIKMSSTRLKQIKKMADDLYTFCASSSSNDVGRLKLIIKMASSRFKQIKKMADDRYTFCASSSNDVGRLKQIIIRMVSSILKRIKKMVDDQYTFCASSSNDVGRLKQIIKMASSSSSSSSSS